MRHSTKIACAVGSISVCLLFVYIFYATKPESAHLKAIDNSSDTSDAVSVASSISDADPIKPLLVLVLNNVNDLVSTLEQLDLSPASSAPLFESLEAPLTEPLEPAVSDCPDLIIVHNSNLPSSDPLTTVTFKTKTGENGKTKNYTRKLALVAFNPNSRYIAHLILTNFSIRSESNSWNKSLQSTQLNTEIVYEGKNINITAEDSPNGIMGFVARDYSASIASFYSNVDKTDRQLQAMLKSAMGTESSGYKLWLLGPKNYIVTNELFSVYMEQKLKRGYLVSVYFN